MNENLLMTLVEQRADEINEARDRELNRRIWDAIHSYAPGFTNTEAAENQPMPFILTETFFTAAKAYNKEKWISQTLASMIRNAEINQP